MSPVTHVGRVMVPVIDQDAAISFYTGKLDFELTADTPFGDGDRWVEVSPPAAERPWRSCEPRPIPRRPHDRRRTPVRGRARDARGDARQGHIDVDAEIMGGDGEVPRLFFFRDGDANQLMVVESPS
jgi:lactoylglutathione lyase